MVIACLFVTKNYIRCLPRRTPTTVVWVQSEVHVGFMVDKVAMGQILFPVLLFSLVSTVGRDSAVGIATRYGLDGPGIESQWGRDLSDRPWGPPSLLYNGYRVSFLGVKRPGRGVDHQHHPVPRLKKEYSYTSAPPLGLRGLFEG